MIAVDLATIEQAGRTAYQNNEHAAPALNVGVQAAIAGLPVGGGAVEILRAFTRGYEAEREAELERLMNEDDEDDGGCAHAVLTIGADMHFYCADSACGAWMGR